MCTRVDRVSSVDQWNLRLRERERSLEKVAEFEDNFAFFQTIIFHVQIILLTITKATISVKHFSSSSIIR